MAKSKYTFGVFIGRFQPLHNAHLEVMLEGLGRVNHLIILLGGACAAPTSKNPFTTAEREEMIRDSLIDAGIPQKRFTILAVRDYYYNEQKWIAEVQAKVMTISKGNQDIALLGYQKDASSYYLLTFPGWDFIATKVAHPMNATEIRAQYFQSSEGGKWSECVPNPVRVFMEAFRETPRFSMLSEEFSYIESYKAEQSKYPWPIIFVTVDALVIRSGHVLVIQRGQSPGKGLYALPGGFLNPDETILQSTIRELKEETEIRILPGLLEDCARETQVFAHPNRSLRGRTVTHATLFDLGSGQLPVVSGADDANLAFWMPVNEVMAHPELFFEDHAHILHHFLMKY